MYIYISISVYIYVYVCVCVYVCIYYIYWKVLYLKDCTVQRIDSMCGGDAMRYLVERYKRLARFDF